MTPSKFKGERLKTKQGAVTDLDNILQITTRKYVSDKYGTTNGGGAKKRSKVCNPHWLRSSRKEGGNGDAACGTLLVRHVQGSTLSEMIAD